MSEIYKMMLIGIIYYLYYTPELSVNFLLIHQMNSLAVMKLYTLKNKIECLYIFNFLYSFRFSQ